MDKRKAWIARNPDKNRAAQRRSRLKLTYGITLEQHDAALEKQGGVCAICSAPPTDRFLAVDHDHATGMFRGLLCLNCNTALGKFKDSAALLTNALLYLEKAHKSFAS